MVSKFTQSLRVVVLLLESTISIVLCRSCIPNWHSNVLGEEVGLLGFAGLQSPRQRELSVDTIDTVDSVEVLHAGNLEASGGTLAGSDRGVSKEVLPDAVPAGTVLGVNLVLVAQPITVPPPESSRIVNANRVDHLDLETSTFKSVDDETKGSGCVCAREDVLVHEQTPSEVLKLPCLAKTSDLQEEDTVVLKHVVDLSEEATQVTNTDVLSHLETCDLVVTTSGDWDFAVVHAENPRLVLLDTSPPETAVTPGSLVAAECDTSDVSTVVDGSEFGESTPAAANVEHLLALLDADLLADDGHFVVLELLESLLAVDVGNDTGSVDHAWTKEPAVEIITAVVVVSDLLFI